MHESLEGLRATNRLIALAQKTSTKESVVIRHELFRVALNDQNVQQLQQTARDLPDLCEWMEASALQHAMDPTSTAPNNEAVLGGLRLYKDCKVIDVPCYLKALWSASQQLASEKGGTATWMQVEPDIDWNSALAQYDAVVLAAGSGLFTALHGLLSHHLILQSKIQLVRGQSIELQVAQAIPALLCGKYMLPTSTPGTVLVGATHEFKAEALSHDQVVAELRQKTESMAPDVWSNSQVTRWTCGYRVQSQRGPSGRMPLLGRLAPDSSNQGLHHPNLWIFTGLSSRGLLYHALYGNSLAEAILYGDEARLFAAHPHLSWWKR
jgi:glycine/D-amino acid oxidase-like deaminating enzyme